MKRTFFLLSLVSLLAANEKLEHSPRLFTHLLDYIAVDYGGAIQKGKVLNLDEYKEQIEFSKTIKTLAQEFPELKSNNTLLKELETLNTYILEKVDPEKVSILARKLSQDAVTLLKIENVPMRWPNLHRGKNLYAQNCAQCHGQQGRGDGPAGGVLDPKPADFHSEKVDQLPPFQLFNAIRLGVPGTAMASFAQFSNAQTWDLAFYVLSLRHGNGISQNPIPIPVDPAALSLSVVATKSDRSLREELPGTEAEKRKKIATVRLSSNDESQEVEVLAVAEEKLEAVLEAFRSGNYELARTNAIVAYLDGIEPIEPRLRAKDYTFTQSLEQNFSAVRSIIEQKGSLSDLEAQVRKALAVCQKAKELLKNSDGSAAFIFFAAAGIFMREAFEAALILITLLGVVRSVGAAQAAFSIHIGWISALGIGLLLWFFSGWLLNISGLQRELLEGVVSAFAVFVLLYFGFWLHRRTQIQKWNAFIKELTQKAVSTRSLFALGTIAFMGVFRECFETVLFLRALLIETGAKQYWALSLGVLSAFILVLFVSYFLIRQSSRVPVRKLFQLSSLVLVMLSLILVGKMTHSFQETGMVGITPVPLPFRSDLFGIFPTFETLLSQIIVLTGIFAFAWAGSLVSTKKEKFRDNF